MIRLDPPAEKEEDSYYEELRNSPVKEMDLSEDETAPSVQNTIEKETVTKPASQTLALVVYQPPPLLLLPAASEPKATTSPEKAQASSVPESSPAPEATTAAQAPTASWKCNWPTKFPVDRFPFL